MVLSAACAAIGVFLQSSIAILIVSSLKQAQTLGSVKHFPWIKRIGLEWTDPPVVSLVLAVTALMMLAGIARFVSRHIAIRIEGRVYTRIARNLLEAASEPMSLLEAYQRRKTLAAAALQRAVLLDARFCGVAIRVLLYNVTQLGQLAVGLGILLVVAPALLAGVGLLVVLGIALVYPLNLHAIQISRSLEREAIARGADIRDSVDEALQYRRGAASSPNLSASPGFSRHSDLWSSRLRVIELSRLTMAVVLAVALGLFVWYGMGTSGPTVHNNVLAAFVGFYFAVLGVQGLAVTATIINRFLPNILRVYRVRQLLVTQHTDDHKSGSGSRRINGVTKMPWRIDDSAGATVGSQQTGVFAVGEVYGLVTRKRDLVLTMFQVIDILSGNKRGFADVCETYLRLLEQNARDRPANPDDEELDWIVGVMAASDLETKPDRARALLAANREPGDRASTVAHFLNDVANLRRLPSPLAFIDGTELLGLGHAGANRVCEALQDKIAFFYTNNLAALQSSPAKQLFVSDGSNIRCAISSATLTEAEKDLARDIFWGRIPRGDISSAASAAEASLAEADAALL